MSQIHSHTDVSEECYAFAFICLSVHRITQKVVDKFLTKFSSSTSHKFCDGVRYLANKKKHSILMLILITEFVAEAFQLQDNSSCKNFVSSSVNE